jgi:hypothetical protein
LGWYRLMTQLNSSAVVAFSFFFRFWNSMRYELHSRCKASVKRLTRKFENLMYVLWVWSFKGWWKGPVIDSLNRYPIPLPSTEKDMGSAGLRLIFQAITARMQVTYNINLLTSLSDVCGQRFWSVSVVTQDVGSKFRVPVDESWMSPVQYRQGWESRQQIWQIRVCGS